MCYRQLHRVELLRQAQEKDGKGKHKRKVVIRGIKPMGKQPATIEIPQWVYFTITRLHYHYMGISELPQFARCDYHSDLWLKGTIYRWRFMYMWCHFQAVTSLPSPSTWKSITFIIHTFNFIIFTSSTPNLWFKTIFKGWCYCEGLWPFSQVPYGRHLL